MKYFFLILIFITFLINSLMSWNECPFEEIDCSGLCGMFIDSDNDSICDLSQLSPEERDSTPEESGTDNVISNYDIISINEELDSISTESESVQSIYNTIEEDIIEEEEIIQNGEVQSERSFIFFRKEKYHLMPIIFILTFLYLISLFLYKKKKISCKLHRKLWNLLLLISFAISFLTAVILIIQINFDLEIIFPFNLLFLHVESGIIMGIISIFHISWHGKYIKNIFQKYA